MRLRHDVSITFLATDGTEQHVEWLTVPRVGDRIALGDPAGSGITGTVATVNWQQGKYGDPVVFIEVTA